MINSKKKGFTIVELVIVIAVIAILAAVLIPTFSNLVKKANTSADIQAVRQMNTVLATEGAVEKPENLNEAIISLESSSIDIEDYKPLSRNMYFYWVKAINQVLYVNEDGEIVFPEQYKDYAYKASDGWYSLCGEVQEDDSWKSNSATISINSGAQLVSLMNDYFSKKDSVQNITTIKLTEDIDLKGAAANFGEVSSNLNIIGEKADGKPVVIYGLRSEYETEKSNVNDANIMSNYGFGFIGLINKNAVVQIKNITFSNAVINSNKGVTGHGAVVVGKVAGDLTLENVSVIDSFVRMEKKAAALVGYLQDGSSLKIIGQTKVENVTIKGGREIAALLAYKQGSLETTGATFIVTNVSVSADESFGWSYSNTTTINGYQNTKDSNYFYATKDNSIKLGVTSSHYWYTNGLTLEQTVGEGKLDIEKPMNFN